MVNSDNNTTIVDKRDARGRFTPGNNEGVKTKGLAQARQKAVIRGYSKQLQDRTGKTLDDCDPVVTLLAMSVDEKLRPELRAACAAKAAPYIRPKLRPIDLNSIATDDSLPMERRLETIKAIMELMAGTEEPASTRILDRILPLIQNPEKALAEQRTIDESQIVDLEPEKEGDFT